MRSLYRLTFREKDTLRRWLHDERGASIVIALVFFLICAVIGSVVLTAASVQAKAVQTNKEMQQAEFVVGSAAQTIGYDLDRAQLTVSTDGKTVTYPEDSQSKAFFWKSFWQKYGVDVLAARNNGTAYTPTDQLTITQDGTTVYGTMTVDVDLNIIVKLSTDQNLDESSPYNMTVYLQCIPAYDTSGRLKSFSYERAVITKANGV